MKKLVRIALSVLFTFKMCALLGLSGCGASPSNMTDESVLSCASYTYPAAMGRSPELKVKPIDTDKPNLLIIGDSISEGYTPFLKERLKGYDVVRVGDTTCTPVNAQGTRFTLENIDHWIAENPNLHTVVWNNGNWDAVAPGSVIWGREHYTDQTEYEANIIAIARKLKATGARVLFFNTNEIKPEFTGFVSGQETWMNSSALNLLPNEGVEVHDMNTVSLSIDHLRPAPNDIHFTLAGSSVLADFVISALEVN